MLFTKNFVKKNVLLILLLKHPSELFSVKSIFPAIYFKYDKILHGANGPPLQNTCKTQIVYNGIQHALLTF